MSVLFYPLLFVAMILGGQPKDFRQIHRDAIVIDSHNDLLMRVSAGDRVEERSTKGHSDLVRFAEAGYDGQVFSVWVDPDITSGYFAYANRLIDSLDAIFKRNPTRVMKVTSAAEFDKARASHRLAGMIGLEGGHAVENSIANILHLYKRGVRYIGLTWNNSTGWASSGRDESRNLPARKGLTDAGKRIVRLMDSLGILIDVSHCGEQTFADVAATSRNPIIASHSSVYAICPHFRNLKDEQIKAIARSGGVMMINFFPAFLDSTFRPSKESALRACQKDLLALEKKHVSDPQKYLAARDAYLRSNAAATLTSILTVVEHIDYVKRLVGIDFVGLGSDFDGISIAPLGLEDVTKTVYLTRELQKRGYTEEDIAKVLGGNFLRVFRKVCAR